MSENKKAGGALDTLALIAGLAIMASLGILAAAVGLTWQPENTSSLITAGAAICGGGLAVFAAVFGVFVGLAVYRRMSRDEQPQQAPNVYPLPMSASAWREPSPPMISAAAEGEWRSVGSAGYDLWEEQPLERVRQ